MCVCVCVCVCVCEREREREREIEREQSYITEEVKQFTKGSWGRVPKQFMFS